MSASARAKAMALSKGISRYLDALEAGSVNGNRNVYLGALDGLPPQTDDPKVVARAIKQVEKQARETTSTIKRLERWQRVITLRDELARLESTSNEGNDVEAFFVEHAKAWAEARGIEYGAFRLMGVPAEVLRAAGIKRGKVKG